MRNEGASMRRFFRRPGDARWFLGRKCNGPTPGEEWSRWEREVRDRIGP